MNSTILNLVRPPVRRAAPTVEELGRAAATAAAVVADVEAVCAFERFPDATYGGRA
jgi:hypothetical protein